MIFPEPSSSLEKQLRVCSRTYVVKATVSSMEHDSGNWGLEAFPSKNASKLHNEGPAVGSWTLSFRRLEFSRKLPGEVVAKHPPESPNKEFSDRNQCSEQ